MKMPMLMIACEDVFYVPYITQKSCLLDYNNAINATINKAIHQFCKPITHKLGQGYILVL